MSPEVPSSYAYCARVARRQARNFYPSFLLLPADRRRAMCALYAFMRRSDDIADEPATAAEKRAALAAWRADLGRALDGRASGSDWAGWPAFADTVRTFGIPARYLTDVLDGVESDVEPRPFATFGELHGYCYRVASAVGLCCLHVWGFRSEGGLAEELAEACGLALQITNIVRDVGEDARNGRVYLPESDLTAFGVSPGDLTAPHAGPALRALLEFEAARAYDYYRRAEPLAALVSPAGRPVLLAIVGVYRRLLDEIARRGYDVLPTRVSVPAWRKVAITARAFAGRFAVGETRALKTPPPP